MANEREKDTREQGADKQAADKQAPDKQAPDKQTSQSAGDQSGLTRAERTPQPQPLAIASPFSIMGRLVDDLSRMMGSFGSSPMLPLGASSLFGAATEMLSVPPIEVFEREGQLVIRADVPGLTKDQVNVVVQDHMLIVSGQRSQEREEKQHGFYRNERGYGRFYRAITLPEQTQVDQAAAVFKNGMLEITLPMAQRPEARRLEIKEMSDAQSHNGQQAAEPSSQTRSAAA